MGAPGEGLYDKSLILDSSARKSQREKSHNAEVRIRNLWYISTVIKFQDIGDLIFVAVLAGAVVTILGSLADARLKRWYGEGKTYKAWIVAGICFVGAMAFVILPRVLPLDIRVAPKNVTIPLPTIDGFGEGVPIILGSLDFTLLGYVLFLFTLVVFTRKLVTGDLFDVESLTRLSSEAAVTLIFISIGLTSFEILQIIGSFHIAPEYVVNSLLPRMIVLIVQIAAILPCISISQSWGGASRGVRPAAILFRTLVTLIGIACAFSTVFILSTR
jgi:hypothetical protein